MTSGSTLLTYYERSLSQTADHSSVWAKIGLLTLTTTACTYSDYSVQDSRTDKHPTVVSTQNIEAPVPISNDNQASKPSVTNQNTLCPGGIVDARRTQIPALAKPPLNVRYIDPALGASILRITDSNHGEVRKPAYSTMQAWNADETLLLLYRSDKQYSGHELRDGHTYEFIRQLNIAPADIEEIFWSHKNPDELFYVSSEKHDHGIFKRLNPRTLESESIADFSTWCGSSLPVAGNDVHMQSYDDDYFGFRCRKETGDHIMFSYRISTDEVHIQAVGKGTGWSAVTAPVSAPSGKIFWYQGKTLDTKLQPLKLAVDASSYQEHSSIGTTHTGQDALYQVAFKPSPNGCDGDVDAGVGHLVQHNLETGACRNIINQKMDYPYPTSSTHLSALSIQRPGRVALSSIGTREQTRYFTNNEPAPALYSEIYLADTNTTAPAICRLAHHRSFGKNATNGGYAPYFGEPHASLSPSGTRIIFGSDWYNSGSVDSFVIELPTYIRP